MFVERKQIDIDGHAKLDILSSRYSNWLKCVFSFVMLFLDEINFSKLCCVYCKAIYGSYNELHQIIRIPFQLCVVIAYWVFNFVIRFLNCLYRSSYNLAKFRYSILEVLESISQLIIDA